MSTPDGADTELPDQAAGDARRDHGVAGRDHASVVGPRPVAANPARHLRAVLRARNRRQPQARGSPSTPTIRA